MIAKIIPIKSVRKSNFLSLVRYLTDQQNKTERVGQINVTNCYTDTLTAALLEIQNTQEMNKRARSDKTCHLVLSFPEGERLSDADLSDIESQFCKALGFGEHQRISVIHDDTDNQHIHIAINKIHPAKHTIHNPYCDYQTVAKLCEQIEQSYGLTQVNHETRIDKTERISQNIETQTGIESLLSWIRRECLDDIKKANTWQDLHQVLQAHDLEIRGRGNGLVFISSSGIAVKASSVDRALSKNNLVQRLGRFEQAAQTKKSSTLRTRSYQPNPLSHRIDTSGLFTRYQQTQRETIVLRKTRWATLRHRRDQLIERAKQEAKLKRNIIKSIPAGRLAKKVWYTTVRLQFKATLSAIKKDYRQSYEQLGISHRKMTWLDWLTIEARNGNSEALAALRSRNDRHKRILGNHISGNPSHPHPSLSAMIESITKDGTIFYRVGTTTVRDDGKRMFISPRTSSESLSDVLQIAIQKYGNHLSVSGTEAFSTSIVQAAVQNRIHVTFDDTKLERYHRQLMKQQLTETRTGNRGISL